MASRSTGGKTSLGNNTAAGQVQQLLDKLNELSRKTGVKYKIDLDTDEIEKGVELTQKFNQLKGNQRNNYYTDVSTALRKTTEAFEKYNKAVAENDPTKIDKAGAEVARWHNAYAALGGDLSKVEEGLSAVAKAQTEALQAASGGGWEYTTEKMKELFDVMSELSLLMQNPTSLSKNYPMSLAEAFNSDEIVANVQKARGELRQMLDEVKAADTDMLGVNIQKRILKTTGYLQAYLRAHRDEKIPEYHEAVDFARAHFETERGSDKLVYRSKIHEGEEQYEKEIRKAERAAQDLIKAEEKLAEEQALVEQRNQVRDLVESIDSLNQGLEEVQTNIDGVKLSTLQAIKNVKEFEELRPRFDDSGAGTERAYTDVSAFNAANDLFESLSVQIRNGLSMDKAVSQMSLRYANDISKGYANAVETKELKEAKAEIEALNAQIRELTESSSEYEKSAQIIKDLNSRCSELEETVRMLNNALEEESSERQDAEDRLNLANDKYWSALAERDEKQDLLYAKEEKLSTIGELFDTMGFTLRELQAIDFKELRACLRDIDLSALVSLRDLDWSGIERLSYVDFSSIASLSEADVSSIVAGISEAKAQISAASEESTDASESKGTGMSECCTQLITEVQTIKDKICSADFAVNLQNGESVGEGMAACCEKLIAEVTAIKDKLLSVNFLPKSITVGQGGQKTSPSPVPQLPKQMTQEQEYAQKIHDAAEELKKAKEAFSKSTPATKNGLLKTLTDAEDKLQELKKEFKELNDTAFWNNYDPSGIGPNKFNLGLVDDNRLQAIRSEYGGALKEAQGAEQLRLSPDYSEHYVEQIRKAGQEIEEIQQEIANKTLELNSVTEINENKVLQEISEERARLEKVKQEIEALYKSAKEDFSSGYMTVGGLEKIKKEQQDALFLSSPQMMPNASQATQNKVADEMYRAGINLKNKAKDLDKIIESSQESSDFESIEKAVRNLQRKMTDYADSMDILTSIDWDKIEKFENKAERIKAYARSSVSQSKKGAKTQESVEKGLDKKIGNLQSYLGKNINEQQYVDFTKEVEEAIQKVEAFKQEIKSAGEVDPDGLKDIENEIGKIGNKAKEIKDAITPADITELKSLAQQASKFGGDSFIPSDIRGKFQKLTSEIEEFASAGGASAETAKRLKQRLIDLRVEANKSGKSFFGTIAERLSKANAQFIAMYFSIHDIVRYIRTAVNTVKELDDAFTEMRKVSDESIKSLKEYQKETFGVAKAVGTTAVELQKSTADWMRLGETMEKAAESSKQATILLNVSEFENISDATESLVAMSQAYKDMSKGEIVDVLNNIGNNFPIATDQLATALKSSAAALMTQGNDLYQAVALVTAGNTVIQDALKTGTGIRTISLRIAGTKEAKKELEEFGEDVEDYVVMTEAKKRQIIKDFTAVASNNGEGVDILDPNGNLKSTYEILLEISKIYKEIQEEDKRFGTNRAKGLVEELAGKNRSNIAASILMNPDILENVYEAAKDSEGSAQEELDKYLDSISGKIEQFKNSLQELESTVISSDLIKGTVDAGTTILNMLTSLTKAFGDFTGAIVAGLGLSILATTKQVDILDGLKKSILSLQYIVKNKDVFSNLSGIKWSDDLKKEMYEFEMMAHDNPLVDFTTDASQGFEQLRITQGKTFSPEVQTLVKNGVMSVDQYSVACQAAATKAKAWAAAETLKNAALNAGISILMSLAVAAVIKGIDHIIHKDEELAKAANEARDKVAELNDELDKMGETVEKSGKRYAELAQGVKDLGKATQSQGGLSNSEYEEFLELSNELADLFPTLRSGFTDTDDSILTLHGDVDEITESLENLLSAERDIANQKILEEASDIFDQDEKLFKKSQKEKGRYEHQESVAKETLAFLNSSERAEQGWTHLSTGELLDVSGLTSQEIEKIAATNAQNLKEAHDAIVAEEREQKKLNTELQKNANLYLRTSFGYGELSSAQQDIARTYIQSLTFEDMKNLGIDSWEGLTDWIDQTLISSISGVDDEALQNKMVEVLSDSTLSAVDKVDLIQEILNSLTKSGYTEEDPLIIYWKSQYEGAVEDYDNAANHILQGLEAGGPGSYHADQMRAKQIAEELTADELAGVMDLTLKPGMIKGVEDLRALLQKTDEAAVTTFKDIGALLSTDVSAGPDWTSARYHELEQEYQKELQLAKETGAELDRTLYGNVDLNNRSVLEWNEENLAKYKDAIESWGDSLEDYAGTVSTVMGTSSEFDGVEIAFTPMLQTPDGAELLDSDTVYRYIDSLISQMPEGWTTEDLLKLDSQGLEIDGKKIKGLIADVGDEAIRVAETMHYLGEDGSLQMLKKEMEAAKESTVTWGDVKDELIGLAQAGKLDEDTLKSYKYYDDILKALGISSEEADEQISDMINAINLMAQQNAVDILTNYKTQVDKLDDAYQKFKNNELIDASTLSALQDAFGDMDSFKEFQQAVMEGQTELQGYFDNMVTEYALENLALSEVTEQTKEWTKQNLIAAGITEESAEKSINAVLANKEAIESNIRAQIEEYNEQVELNDSTRDLSVSTEDLNKLTAKEVSELLKAANASGTAAQQIALFTLKKELASGKSLRNADDIAYLKELIIQAGVGIELINQLQHLKKVSDAQGGNKDEYEAFMKRNPNQQSWNPAQWAEYNAKYADVWGVVEFEKTYDQVWDEVDKKYKEMFNYTENVGLGYGGAMKDAAKSASDAAKEFKDALDKILAMYDAELDAGVISFQTYVDKSRAIIEQYYRDGKLTAQDYYDELASFYEKQVQQYDKVISAVQKKLSEETDALEKQKENVEKSYNEQIEVIQKKIDALKDENDEIDRNMALSKAQYELARAQNQRTRLLYSESRGFYYEADLKGISDAEENVRKAKTDKMVSEYEKQIKSLQDAMESETKSIDEQIKKLNEYSEAWGKVSSKLEDAQNTLRATEVLGPDWETNIKSGLETLNDFTKQYVAAQESQKQAYLAARTAEANNPVGGGGGGTSGNNGGNGGTNGNNGNNGNNGGKTKTTKWIYNGKEYDTEKQAKAAKDDDELEVYESNRKSYINSHSNAGTPEWAMKKVREDADKYAMGILEDFRKNHKITTKTYFSGTDSAKPGKALIGEFKPEIVVHKDGTASIVDEPTLMNLKGGEKIFNGDETEKILKSKYKPLSSVNPKKFAMLHAFANGTSSPMQSAIAAQAVGIASGIKSGLFATASNGGQTINQTFNVSLPNITDASKAQDLFREFEQLSRKATQYFN